MEKTTLLSKKNIVLGIVLLLVFGLIYYLESGKAGPSDPLIPSNSSSSPSNSDEKTTLSPYQKWETSLTEKDLERILRKEKLYPKTPELAGISGYLNSEEGIKIEDFRGKVVLIDFWTYTCINCIRTLPYLTEWDRKYRDSGLVIIGVHTPEFEFEKKKENVLRAMQNHGIEYRVVQDNDYATWREFKNRYWPRKFIIDADGFIRYDHIGEGAYSETEKMIQQLLSEGGVVLTNMSTSSLDDKTPKGALTPELYAGYNFNLPRGQNIGNKEGLKAGEDHLYLLAQGIPKNTITLEGKWLSGADELSATKEGARIYLLYSASSVNIVGYAKDPTKLLILKEGDPLTANDAGSDVEFGPDGKSYVLIDEPRLYNIISSEYNSSLLSLTSEKEGFSFNAFTFG